MCGDEALLHKLIGKLSAATESQTQPVDQQTETDETYREGASDGQNLGVRLIATDLVQDTSVGTNSDDGHVKAATDGEQRVSESPWEEDGSTDS